MSAAPGPPSPHEPAPRSLQLLQQIADTLGVGIDALHEPLDAPREPFAHHLLHRAEDGTLWFLVSGPDGRPAVRQVGIASGHLGTADEPVDRFAARSGHTPQGRALTTLIDRLLLGCLR